MNHAFRLPKNKAKQTQFQTQGNPPAPARAGYLPFTIGDLPMGTFMGRLRLAVVGLLMGEPVLDLRFYEVLGLVERGRQVCAGGHIVASAAEFLGDLSHVDGAAAPQRAADAAVVQFDKEGGRFDGAYAPTLVDEVFGVGLGRAGAFEVAARQLHGSVSAGQMQLERVEHGDHKLEAGMREILVEIVVDLGGVGAGGDQVGAVAEGSGVGVAELEPAGVGGDGDKEGLGDSFGDRPAGELEQVVDDEAGGGSRGVNELDVAEAVAGDVVVDDEDGPAEVFEVVVEVRQLAVTVGVYDDEQVGVGELGAGELLEGDIFAEDGDFFGEEEAVPFGDVGEEYGFGFFAEGGQGVVDCDDGGAGVAVGAGVGG